MSRRPDMLDTYIVVGVLVIALAFAWGFIVGRFG